jgi:hypothetical protein
LDVVVTDGGDSIEVLRDGSTPEQAEDTERPTDERLGVMESGRETGGGAKRELGHNSVFWLLVKEGMQRPHFCMPQLLLRAGLGSI